MIFKTILLQDTQIIKEGLSAFEKITNPILILLIVVLLLGIFFMYKYFTKLILTFQEQIKHKDDRIQVQHDLLVNVKTEDAKIIVELQKTLENLINTDKEYTNRLSNITELLQQLLIKADILFKINSTK